MAANRVPWNYREPWRYLLRLPRIPREFVHGLEYGFPICCNLRFCLDALLNAPSAQARGVTFKRILNEYNEDGCYVPCETCAKQAKAVGAWRGW